MPQGQDTTFSVVRYGNVVGSRGSVVPLFFKQRETGKITITDSRMTRFWITLEQAVQFVFDSLDTMQGGEIFVPKIPTMNIMDLAKAIAPDAKIDMVGIRPGEKLHEVLITEDEARTTIEEESRYVVLGSSEKISSSHQQVPEFFSYSSDQNHDILDQSRLTSLLESKSLVHIR